MNREAVFKQLKIDEGVKYEIYNDHLGLPTFGVGHLVTKNDPEFGKPIGTSISEERVRTCFDRDLDTAISECDRLYENGVFRSLPGDVQEILVNMMFNMGRPRLSGFKKFLAAVKAKNFKEAAKEGRDSRWYDQVKNRAERLMSSLEKIGN